MGEGRGYFLVWGCHKAPPLALLPQGTGSVPSNNLSGGAHSFPTQISGTPRGGVASLFSRGEQGHCWALPMPWLGRQPRQV